ncbi:CoA pyrophosphatase [Cellulomonas cellasea]|uniref:NUDIX hydrolase n=1 Tax=Cellulomonas cellasea TaxID=43670 RepID=UPI0025A3ED51|nr:CoA pyrophosphatase [Cellulomonas cellasea]MDM8085409.1 CoA pyrophosphatase [Cellulomonas cellasea]
MSEPEARRQLAALCATGGERWAQAGVRALRQTPSTGRPAAVLVLFGVLDHAPALETVSSVGSDLDVLLTRRSATLGHHPGQVSFPGGRLDPGDRTPAEAALREAREETGLDPAGVDILGTLPQVPVTVSRHLVTPVVGWWTRPSPVVAVDHAETADVFRVPVADLLHPANRRTATLTRGARTYSSPAFLAGEHVVWGFTALVLDAMFDTLGWNVPWDATRTVPAPA